MTSILQVRPFGCISRDDADAIQTLYGGSCSDKVLCYDYPINLGITRFFTALGICFVFVVALTVFFKFVKVVKRKIVCKVSAEV